MIGDRQVSGHGASVGFCRATYEVLLVPSFDALFSSCLIRLSRATTRPRFAIRRLRPAVSAGRPAQSDEEAQRGHGPKPY